MQSILIVEDDLALQKVYKEVLEHEGFTTTVCGSGADALQAIKTQQFSLVLLDIMLPGGMNGFEILQEMKNDEKAKNTPVVVLTNLDSEKHTALDYGAADYFFKPDMHPHSLVEKVKSHLPQA